MGIYIKFAILVIIFILFYNVLIYIYINLFYILLIHYFIPYLLILFFIFKIIVSKLSMPTLFWGFGLIKYIEKLSSKNIIISLRIN